MSQPAEQAPPTAPRLGRASRVVLVVLFFYVCFYTFPFPVDRALSIMQSAAMRVWENPTRFPHWFQKTLEVQGRFNERETEWTDRAVLWTAKEVLHLEKDVAIIRINGSGDSTYDWIVAGIRGSLSLALGLVFGIWAAFSRGTSRFWPLLGRILEVWVRWYLLLFMLSYGFAKVIPSQFPTPRLDRLMMPYADSSPMGLVWRFMGHSTAYCIFSGACEVVAGLLLVCRKTRTLGAIVTLAVMTNVVMINYCFDVPVKLFSSHLWLMAAGLLLVDSRRMLDFFILNRATSARPLRSLFGSRVVDVLVTILKIALVAFISYDMCKGIAMGVEQRALARVDAPLLGVHEIEWVTRDGILLPPPNVDEKERWRTIVFESTSMAAIRTMDDRWLLAQVTFDAAEKTITLGRPFALPAPGEAVRFTSTGSAATSMPTIVPTTQPSETVYRWTAPEAGALELTGQEGEHLVVMRLRTRDPGEFLLMSRGFHWINERPFHR